MPAPLSTPEYDWIQGGYGMSENYIISQKLHPAFTTKINTATPVTLIGVVYGSHIRKHSPMITNMICCRTLAYDIQVLAPFHTHGAGITMT